MIPWGSYFGGENATAAKEIDFLKQQNAVLNESLRDIMHLAAKDQVMHDSSELLYEIYEITNALLMDAPATSPDAFDFCGRKVANALVNTWNALQGFTDSYRRAGEVTLEEFFFRLTGKDLDIELLRSPNKESSPTPATPKEGQR